MVSPGYSSETTAERNAEGVQVLMTKGKIMLLIGVVLLAFSLAGGPIYIASHYDDCAELGRYYGMNEDYIGAHEWAYQCVPATRSLFDWTILCKCTKVLAVDQLETLPPRTVGGYDAGR